MTTAERILGVAMRITQRTSKLTAAHAQIVFVVRLPAPNRHHHLHEARWGVLDKKYYNLVTDDKGVYKIPTFEYHDNFVEHQGFYTDAREFVSREEGLRIATANGQLLRKSGNPHSEELFSEDMW
jgi:hypothetical protein